MKMFSFKKNKEEANLTNHWFVGIHISSAVRKLEASLLGCDEPKAGASLILQKSVSFDLPEEITVAYEEVLESVRMEQDAIFNKRVSKEAFLEESDLFFQKTTTSPRSNKKTLTPESLTKLSFLRSIIAEIQEEAFSELLSNTNTKKENIVAIALNDPVIWLDVSDFNPNKTYYPLSDANLLASRTGVNVIYSFIPGDWSPLGYGRAFLSFPYWILLSSSNNNRLLLDLGETARWTYIPSRKTPDSWTQIRYREIGPCGSLLNLFTRQATKGKSLIDLGGKLAVQGRSPSELIDIWQKNQSKALESDAFPPRYYASSYSGLLNETFYYEALKSAPPRKYSSLDTLCASVHLVVEQIKESIETNARQFTEPYDVVLTGATKENGLLFSKLSTFMGSNRFHKLSEYGFPEDSFDATAVATLGILFTAGIPAALTEIHGVRESNLLGKIIPGSTSSWNQFLKITHEMSNL